MADESSWSEGTKWLMGILAAVIVAFLVAKINRSPGPTPAPASVPTPINPATIAPPKDKTQLTSPKPFAAIEQLFGSWNFEYGGWQQSPGSPDFRRRMTFGDKNRLAIDNPRFGGIDVGQPFSTYGGWTYDAKSSLAQVTFDTKVPGDTGQWRTDFLYHNVTCRLQLDQAASLLQGRCVDGGYTTLIRLTR